MAGRAAMAAPDEAPFVQLHPCASVLACTVPDLDVAFLEEAAGRQEARHSSATRWDDSDDVPNPVVVVRWLHAFHSTVDVAMADTAGQGGLWKFGSFGPSFCVAANVVHDCTQGHAQLLLDLVLQLQDACGTVRQRCAMTGNASAPRRARALGGARQTVRAAAWVVGNRDELARGNVSTEP